MFRRPWSLLLAPLVGLAACSHAPSVNEERVATLTPAQLTSVRADQASVAQAELAHQQALLEQSKFQALVQAKDPSVQGVKAEDFAERVRKSAERARDAQGDAARAQQRYQEQHQSWQSQAQGN